MLQCGKHYFQPGFPSQSGKCINISDYKLPGGTSIFSLLFVFPTLLRVSLPLSAPPDAVPANVLQYSYTLLLAHRLSLVGFSSFCVFPSCTENTTTQRRLRRRQGRNFVGSSLYSHTSLQSLLHPRRTSSPLTFRKARNAGKTRTNTTAAAVLLGYATMYERKIQSNSFLYNLRDVYEYPSPATSLSHN